MWEKRRQYMSDTVVHGLGKPLVFRWDSKPQLSRIP